MKRLELRTDYDEIYAFIVKRAKAFDPATNRGPGKGRRVSRIDIGFDARDRGRLCLVFDTRRSPQPDGRWKKHVDGTVLERPRWAKAFAAVKGGALLLESHDGRRFEFAKRDTKSLVTALGDLLQVALLQARNDGAFAALPQAPRCELGVEELGGSYRWPAPEARGIDNTTEIPAYARPAPPKKSRKLRLIPEKQLEPLRAEVERLGDERDYGFTGLSQLPYYHALVYYLMFSHFRDELRQQLGDIDDDTAMANACFWYSVVFAYSRQIKPGTNPLAGEMDAVEGAPTLHFSEEDYIDLIKASEKYVADRPMSRAEKAAARKVRL